jgi:predicted dehydrogenase
MHFYFGEIAWVRTAPEPVLGFKKGFTAALYSFDDSHFRIIEMDIIGAKGRIRLKDAERVMEYYKTGRHPWVKDLKALKPQKTFKYGIDLLQPIRAVLTDIVDCIENKKKPLCSGEDGLMALAVVKAIEESYRRNGAKINVRYV